MITPAHSRPIALAARLGSGWCWGLVWTLWVGSAALGAPAASAPARANTAPAPLVIPQSVFVDDPAKGLDPFFPQSTRRQQSTQKVDPADPAVADAKIAASLVVRGIVIGNRNRRMALINNQVFDVGEIKTNALLIDGVGIPVRCVEIREDSVLVVVGNKPEPRKLPLNKSLSGGGKP